MGSHAWIGINEEGPCDLFSDIRFAGFVLANKKALEKEYKRCKRIEKETASELWREGARWNMKLIEELLK